MPEESPAGTQKQEMTSLDMRFLVRELRNQLSGGKVRKIYQYGKAGSRQFLFEVYIPKEGGKWLYIDSNKMFLTRFKKVTPLEPPSFCMFLRKHMMGKQIKSIRQYEFDRIVEITTDENILIIEMFSTGNMILCDTLYNIIMPLEFQKWKGREVKPKVPYKYPPKMTNPFNVDFDVMRRALLKSDKPLAGFLATSLSLGPDYANEAVERAGLDPRTESARLSTEQALKAYQAVQTLDEAKPKPSVYRSFVAPFPMMSLSKEQPRYLPTMSEAFDEFFSSQQIELARTVAVKEASSEQARVERVVTQQAQAEEKWKRIMAESQEKGNLIYHNYPTVDAALQGISKAKGQGMSWSEIKGTLLDEQSPEAESVKEIREGDGLVVLELSGKVIEIEFNKSVEDNAARYYEDAKWARKKLEGLGVATEEFSGKLTEAELKKDKVIGEDFKNMLFAREKPAFGQSDNDAEVEAKPIEGVDRSPEVERKPKKKRWYESFKWFFSSDGFLAVAGRNADQNEALLKRHTDPTDVVFHADIPGAAFVVIKSQGLEVPELTKREAAEFAASNSKAWARGLGTIDIFSVPRERVSKTPPSGQYLPKGSFMIHGERQWYRNLELKMAIGVKLSEDRLAASVVSGPVMAVRKHSDYFITIKPGLKKSLEIARLVKNKILVKARPDDRFPIEKVSLDEIQVLIPSGMADVVEQAGEAV